MRPFCEAVSTALLLRQGTGAIMIVLGFVNNTEIALQFGTCCEVVPGF